MIAIAIKEQYEGPFCSPEVFSTGEVAFYGRMYDTNVRGMASGGVVWGSWPFKSVHLSDRATRRLRRYDEGEQIEPFTFNLEL